MEMKLTGRGAEVSEGGGGSSMAVFEAFCVSRRLALEIYRHKQRERVGVECGFSPRCEIRKSGKGKSPAK